MSPTIAHSLLNRFNHKKPSLNANHVFAPMSSDEVFFIHDMSCQMKRGGPVGLTEGRKGGPRLPQNSWPFRQVSGRVTPLSRLHWNFSRREPPKKPFEPGQGKGKGRVEAMGAVVSHSTVDSLVNRCW